MEVERPRLDWDWDNSNQLRARLAVFLEAQVLSKRRSRPLEARFSVVKLRRPVGRLCLANRRSRLSRSNLLAACLGRLVAPSWERAQHRVLKSLSSVVPRPLNLQQALSKVYSEDRLRRPQTTLLSLAVLRLRRLPEPACLVAHRLVQGLLVRYLDLVPPPSPPPATRFSVPRREAQRACLECLPRPLLRPPTVACGVNQPNLRSQALRRCLVQYPRKLFRPRCRQVASCSPVRHLQAPLQRVLTPSRASETFTRRPMTHLTCSDLTRTSATRTRACLVCQLMMRSKVSSAKLKYSESKSSIRSLSLKSSVTEEVTTCAPLSRCLSRLPICTATVR